MMDNLICRGKVKYNSNHYFSGEWVMGFVLKRDFSDKVYILDIEEEFRFGNSKFEEVEVIPETVGRCTGYHECNNVNVGNKIFQGDLLQSIHNCEEQYEVVWVLGGWMIKDSITVQYLDEMVDELEIIGNVYNSGKEENNE